MTKQSRYNCPLDGMEEVNVPEDAMFQWAKRGLKVQLHDSANSPVSLNTMTD